MQPKPDFREGLWKDFLQRWPLEKLPEMTLTEYSTTGSDDSFGNWVERRTRPLGSILGGSSFKFGVYLRANKEVKEDKLGRLYNEKYGWLEKYGDTPEAAYKKVHAEIVKVAQAARKGDLETVEKADLGYAFRWKIAFLYQDRNNPCVVPIFNKAMLRKLFSEPKISVVDGHRQLIAQKGDESLPQYGSKLWAIANDESDTKTISSKTPSTPTKKHNLNSILYGPPGTGKTYRTTSLAVQIADPSWYAETLTKYDNPIELRTEIKKRYLELVKMQRVVFTTFHQSFSYEDFVEGIRASSEGEQLKYEVVDGVFKQLCSVAEVKVESATKKAIDLTGRKIWKMSLGNTLSNEEEIYEECIENDYVLLGYGEDIDFSKCESREDVKQHIEKTKNTIIDSSDYTITAVNFIKNAIKSGDLIVVSDGNHKFRAIAEVTGDYEFHKTEDRADFRQMRPVKWLQRYSPSQPIEQLFLKNLSQQALYELKPTTIDHTKLKQLLTPIKCDSETKKPHVLIIDEINRGNISRIFGELITLLEPSKRSGETDEQSVVLPYSKRSFSVPNNVYVIGTMNTADRSLAQLDLALRRRFSFIEMLPDPTKLEDTTVYDIEVADILTVINQRIEVLLDAEHTIGHSYFMPLVLEENEEDRQAILAEIFGEKIIPLLREYFFDDYERIAWVLNDTNKSNENRFIQMQNTDKLPPLNTLFPDEIASQLIDRRYHINRTALTSTEAYQGILK